MCRGACCKMRGRENHAFIQRSTLIRVLKNSEISIENPDVSIENIVSTYLSHIPEKATINSCVYHGALGCVLPEYLRADICSDFFCSALSEHINKHVEQGSPGNTLVFAVNESDIYDVATVSDSGSKKDVAY